MTDICDGRDDMAWTTHAMETFVYGVMPTDVKNNKIKEIAILHSQRLNRFEILHK